MLKVHWIEENQHVKTDLLEIDQLASRMGPDELRAAFEDAGRIIELIDGTFRGQVEREIATLERVRQRELEQAQRGRLRDALHRSTGAIWADVALTHPRFVKVARELSPAGAAALGVA